MRKATKVYLNDKLLEVYEVIDELKSKRIHDVATDSDLNRLSVAEAELSIIKTVLEFEVRNNK